MSLWQPFIRSAPVRLSEEDRKNIVTTALYQGKAGLEAMIAKYPGLDLAAEKDAFTRALHGGIEREFGQDRETVQYIIQQGADTNKADSAYGRMLPLGRACARAKSTGVCEDLIAGGANVDKADADGKTPMIHAMETDRLSEEKIAVLAKHGANLNTSGSKAVKPPLSYAAGKGNVELGKLLARHGADTTITDQPKSPGNLALKEAIENSNFSFVDFLLESETCQKPDRNKKLNPFLKQAIDSTTEKPLSEAEQYQTIEPNSRRAIISALVDKGADLDSLDKKTALKFWKSMRKIIRVSTDKIMRDIEARYGNKEYLSP